MKVVSCNWQHKGGTEYAIYDGDTQLTHGGCGCCSDYDEVISDEHVARLMAAAPEMLRLLRQLDKYGPDSVDTTELLDRLNDIQFKEE